MRPIYKTRNVKPRFAGGRQGNFCSASSLFFLYPDRFRKVSICYTDREEFGNAYHAYSLNSFKGNLSLVLIDGDTGEIKEEVYISSYSDDQRKPFPLRKFF